MKFDTKVVRAGISPDPTTGAIIPPIYQSTTFVIPEIGKDKGFDYTRSANPTRQLLETNLAAIEGGKHGICYASGMAAVDSCLRLLKAGDHVVCSDDVYGGVSRLFNDILQNFELDFSYVDTSIPNLVEKAIRPETKMLWVETPTNPLLKISDLDAMGKIARQNDLIYAVDSTFTTPVILRPLEYGADLVIHSTTKYLSGHNQIIGGIVITNNDKYADDLRFVQKSIGAVPSPFDCWLTISGVKTLSLRMQRHSENGQAVAEYLAEHPKVERIIYPGLPSHPQYEIACRQMDNFGGMISFELKGGIPAGIKLMNNLKLCSLAESLGAVETMVTHPATMTHPDVPRDVREARGLTDGLVRLSVGIEDPQDIIDDLNDALDKI